MKARILRGMVILLSVHAGSLEEKLWFLISRILKCSHGEIFIPVNQASLPSRINT